MRGINVLVSALVSIITTVFICVVTLGALRVKDGEQGLPGPPGATGLKGDKGDKGDKGERGMSYKRGASKEPYPPSFPTPLSDL